MNKLFYVIKSMYHYCQKINIKWYILLLLVFIASIIISYMYKSRKVPFRKWSFKDLNFSFGLTYYCLLLVVAVFSRESSDTHKINLDLFWSYRAYLNGMRPELLEEIIVNVLMFMPLGFVFALFFKSLPKFKFLSIGIFASIGIEILQFVLCKGLLETDDIINNFIGFIIGVLLFNCIRELIRLAKRITFH